MSRTLFALVVFLACAAVGVEQYARFAFGQASSTRRRVRRVAQFDAPPPQWDASVLDLFFTDAASALGPGSPPTAALVGDAAPRASDTPARPAADKEPAATDAEATNRAEQIVWSNLISRESLEDEVKDMAQSLDDLVQNAGRFKSGGYQDVRVQLTSLAVLFGLIDQYDDDVRWKDAAAEMRDRVAQAGKNCKAGSDATYQEARSRVEELSDLVRGSSAAPGQSPEWESWAAVADRRALMSRFEGGLRDRVVPWTAGQQDFERHAPALLREAELLAAFSRVIQDESYEYGDDSTYLEYARELEAAFTGLRDAMRANDFNRAAEAAAAANRSCDRCHGDFRG